VYSGGNCRYTAGSWLYPDDLAAEIAVMWRFPMQFGPYSSEKRQFLPLSPIGLQFVEG
jgi:hypothetical protein